MVKMVELAKKAARKAIESTYDGICTIIEYKDSVNEYKITQKQEVIVLENQPCHLSFEKITPTVQTETAGAVGQSTKLFIAPEVKISAGSKIIVEQCGVRTEYAMSGVPAVYDSHAEIMLELFNGWA